MKIIVDTSVLIAVALGEPERDGLIRAAGDVPVAWEAIQAIPVELRAIEFLSALEIATRFGVYAYDAYYLDCALRLRAPLLTLDRAMKHIASELSIPVLEHES